MAKKFKFFEFKNKFIEQYYYAQPNGQILKENSETSKYNKIISYEEYYLK